MAQVNTTVNKSTQSTLNNIMQTSTAACSATCTQIQSGNVVFINNSNTGNITFNQTCTVNAQCTINNAVEASANTVQKAIQNGSAKSSWFGGFGINTAVNLTNQEIVNMITQSLNSTCNNGVTQVQEGNLIYVNNSTTGDIGFNQESNVNSTCVLNNNARGVVASTQSADQVASAGAAGLGIIIAIIIIIIVIIVIIALVRGLNKKNESGKTSTQLSDSDRQAALSGAAQGARAGPEGAAAGAAAGVAQNRVSSQYNKPLPPVPTGR